MAVTPREAAERFTGRLRIRWRTERDRDAASCCPPSKAASPTLGAVTDSQIALIVTGAVALAVPIGAWKQERWRARREDNRVFRHERLVAYGRLSASCSEFVSGAQTFASAAQRVNTTLKAVARPTEARSVLGQIAVLDEAVQQLNEALATCRLVASDALAPHLDRLAAVALGAAELTQAGNTAGESWDGVLDQLRERREQFEAAARIELQPPGVRQGLPRHRFLRCLPGR